MMRQVFYHCSTAAGYNLVRLFSSFSHSWIQKQGVYSNSEPKGNEAIVYHYATHVSDNLIRLFHHFITP